MNALVISPAARTLANDMVRDAIAPDPGTARALRTGMIAVGVLVLGFGGLAATVPIEGAVIAPGEIDVESRVKPISHPTGGVVSALLVKDGDHVRRNQVLVRLDDRVSGAQAHYLGASVDQLLAAEARLIATRDDAVTITFPPQLTLRSDNADVAAVIEGAKRSFMASRAALASQRAELAHQIQQAAAERDASDSRRGVLLQQRVLIGNELDMVRRLYAQRYTTIERLGALERNALELKAGSAAASASAIEAASHIAELRARIASLADQAHVAAARELADVQSRLTESQRAKAGADDSFDRAVVRAPQDGTVDKLILAGVGGAVPAGEPLMQIVPDSDARVVRVRVPVDDIDQVALGRSVRVRVNALDARSTPELQARISEVAASRTVDQRTGATYFSAIVRIVPGQERKLDNVRLHPGMSVETYITSSSRTLGQLLLRPIAAQMRRAFRHD